MLLDFIRERELVGRQDKDNLHLPYPSARAAWRIDLWFAALNEWKNTNREDGGSLLLMAAHRRHHGVEHHRR